MRVQSLSHRWHAISVITFCVMLLVSTLLVALNFAPKRRNVDLHLPFGGRWLDVVSGTQHTLKQGAHAFTLEPFSGLLLVPARTS